MTTIAVIVGSLRKGSFNRLLAQALREVAPASFELNEVAIGELPFYNEDLDTGSPPAQWRSFREQIRNSDAVLFITPEYNRGVPGVVKNAIDVGSRPMKDSIWRGRPSTVISLTRGKLGAMAANHNLKHTLGAIGSPVMAFPEANLGDADSLFDASGKLTNEHTRKFLGNVMTEFDSWIGRFK